MQSYERAARDVLSRYLEALNAQDSAGMRESFHFPHYRFSAGRVEVFETAQDYGIEHFHNRSDTDGWSYTKWDYRTMIHGDEDKVHFDVQFTRYRVDDSVLGTYKSLWIVTKRDGNWGVLARSSYAA
jgi:hypothetical protein